MSCDHIGLCCCDTLSKLKSHPNAHHLLKFHLKTLGVHCPESQLTNAHMVAHIRNCCGYGELLDALAYGKTGEDADNYIISTPRCSYFIFYLAQVLTYLPSPDYYDRIYNCVHILRAFLTQYVFEDQNHFESATNPQVLVDFIFCFVNIPQVSNIICEFELLLEFSVSDLETALVNGACLPGNTEEICREIRKHEPELRGKLDLIQHEPFVSVYILARSDTEISLSGGDGFGLRLCPSFYKRNLEYLKDGTEISAERLQDVLPALGYVEGSFTSDKIPHIIETFAKLNLPVYFYSQKIQLYRPLGSKSARK